MANDLNVDLGDPINVDLLTLSFVLTWPLILLLTLVILLMLMLSFVLSTANSFLHLLATETGGRYHRCPDDFNADMFAHKLLSEGFGDSEVNSTSCSCCLLLMSLLV